MKATVGVITISDKGAAGQREDTSGPALCQLVEEYGYEVVYKAIVPDEKVHIERELLKCADELNISLILTTGGTGFSKRDITPEVTLSVIERQTPGIPEAMRAASMKITPRGCLSRSVAGIRGNSLIINLPGSKKAAIENLEAVIEPIGHGLEMLESAGSADCAGEESTRNTKESAAEYPSMDQWIKEAKNEPDADKIGMYLTHNGVVRSTAKALVRSNQENTKEVIAMKFSYDQEKVDQVISDAKKLDGIYYVRIWLNEGQLNVGESLMYVLIGGDIRPNVTKALDYVVGRIKSECVKEEEIY